MAIAPPVPCNVDVVVNVSAPEMRVVMAPSQFEAAATPGYVDVPALHVTTPRDVADPRSMTPMAVTKRLDPELFKKEQAVVVADDDIVP